MSAYKGPQNDAKRARQVGVARLQAQIVYPWTERNERNPRKIELGSRQQGALELFAVRDDLLIPCSARRATRIDIASCSNVIAAARYLWDATGRSSENTTRRWADQSPGNLAAKA